MSWEQMFGGVAGIYALKHQQYMNQQTNEIGNQVGSLKVLA